MKANHPRPVQRRLPLRAVEPEPEPTAEVKSQNLAILAEAKAWIRGGGLKRISSQGKAEASFAALAQDGYWGVTEQKSSIRKWSEGKSLTFNYLQVRKDVSNFTSAKDEQVSDKPKMNRKAAFLVQC